MTDNQIEICKSIIKILNTCKFEVSGPECISKAADIIKFKNMVDESIKPTKDKPIKKDKK